MDRLRTGPPATLRVVFLFTLFAHVLGWPCSPAVAAPPPPPPSADLALAKSGPSLAATGNTISFTLTVTNLGPADASDVVVTDALPPELVFKSCVATGGGVCGGSGNARTVTFPALASGASATVTLDVNVSCSASPGAVIVNTAGAAAASPPDPDATNNTASASVTIVVQPPPPPPPLQIVAPDVVGAFSPNRTASLLYPFGSSFTWTISNGTITSGQGTPEITFTAGSPGVLDLGVTESNPPACYSFQGSKIITVVPAGTAVLYYPLDPCRVIDTRDPLGALGGPSLAPAGVVDRSFPVAGACGIPADATTITANVTVTNAFDAGTLLAYPGDGAPGTASTISFGASQTRANNAHIRLATDGSGTIRIQNTSPGTVDVVVDVTGYYR
jgi:uncharacterized repeat protein (TIGR01451 family)